MLKVNFLHVCENAIVEQGSGNLSIIGIFENLKIGKAIRYGISNSLMEFHENALAISEIIENQISKGHSSPKQLILGEIQ